MNIALDFLLNVCVGTIGLIAIVTFACLLTIGMNILFDYRTPTSETVRKVWDIVIKIICIIILIIFCYGTGARILEKFL